jgi:hypothetical protein
VARRMLLDFTVSTPLLFSVVVVGGGGCVIVDVSPLLVSGTVAVEVRLTGGFTVVVVPSTVGPVVVITEVVVCTSVVVSPVTVVSVVSVVSSWHKTWVTVSSIRAMTKSDCRTIFDLSQPVFIYRNSEE